MHKINLSNNLDSVADTNHEPVLHQNRIDEKEYLGQNQNSNIHQNHNPSPYANLGQLDLNNKTQDMTKKSKNVLLIISILAIGLGSATGYGAYKLNAKSGPGSKSSNKNLQQVAEGTIKVGDVFGVQDPETFKDSAEGYLEDGGVSGEGSHKLLRAGGETQTVVLTSSVTDLSKFTGMEVKVWGETFKAQKAGWLMDVGRVEVVNTKGSAPSEE